MFTLTREEGEKRWQNIRRVMAHRKLDCLIIWGSSTSFRNVGASVKYLSNATTEGYLVFPLEGEPTLFTFQAGHEPNTWVNDCRSGFPTYGTAISERIKELHLESGHVGAVGISGYFGEVGFPYTTYNNLINNFPKAKFEDATDIVEDARLVKSEVEIRCLEIGCDIADKVLQKIKETAGVGVKDFEVLAVMMDTLFREGSEPASMVLYCSGKEHRHAGDGGYFQAPSQKALESGDIILVEFDSKYLGYVAQYNQPYSVGAPNKEWQDIIAVARESYGNALKVLRPGITVGALDEAFITPIREAGYTFRNPPFHGIGLALEMPMGTYPAQPRHKPDASLKLEAGMVLEFEPHVVTLDGKKGLHIGIPVAVTETGCRQLSKIWKPELIIV